MAYELSITILSSHMTCQIFLLIISYILKLSMQRGDLNSSQALCASSDIILILSVSDSVF